VSRCSLSCSLSCDDHPLTVYFLFLQEQIKGIIIICAEELHLLERNSRCLSQDGWVCRRIRLPLVLHVEWVQVMS
jgi:hypothetical protein